MFKDPLILVENMCFSYQSLQMKAEQHQAAKKVSEQGGCDEHIYDSKDTVKVELMSYPLSHKR